MLTSVLSKPSLWLVLCCVTSLGHAQMCSNTEQRAAPDTRYRILGSVNGNEVLDTQTNLVWQRCSMGQRWTGQQCKGKVQAMTWSEAKSSAQALGSGYRLPTLPELQSLVDRSCYNAAYNENMFPNGQPDAYWSATPVSNQLAFAHYVDFYYGMPYQDNRGNLFYVRAVRDATP